MKLYKLAKKVANFIWDFDPYNAKDYYDSFGDAVAETLIGLSSPTQRKAIYDFLLDIKAEVGGEDAIYAEKLAREVKAI